MSRRGGPKPLPHQDPHTLNTQPTHPHTYTSLPRWRQGWRRESLSYTRRGAHTRRGRSRSERRCLSRFWPLLSCGRPNWRPPQVHLFACMKPPSGPACTFTLSSRPGRCGSRLSSPDSRVGICSSTYHDPLVTPGLLPLQETEYRASCEASSRAEARKLSLSLGLVASFGRENLIARPPRG